MYISNGLVDYLNRNLSIGSFLSYMEHDYAVHIFLLRCNATIAIKDIWKVLLLMPTL